MRQRLILAEADVALPEEFLVPTLPPAPGTVVAAEQSPDTGRIVVACGNGTALSITQLVPEGKRPMMKAGELLRGSPLSVGARLG